MFARLPDYFLAVNRRSINDRANLSVRRAQVKADAVALQVTPQQFPRLE